MGRRMALYWMNCPCTLVTEYFGTDLGRLVKVVMEYVLILF